MQSFRFHPAVARWFEQTFGSPTEPQVRGWPAIQSGRHVLISAPTGSGKTLAAFLASLDALFREGARTDLPDETQVVYVSPLKALSNDIRKNLQEPLAGIRALLRETEGRDIDVRAEVRTGDTTAAQRQALIKKPPHILVTTPESLYLLLTSESGRRHVAHGPNAHHGRDSRCCGRPARRAPRLEYRAVGGINEIRVGGASTNRSVRDTETNRRGGALSSRRAMQWTRLAIRIAKSSISVIAANWIWRSNFRSRRLRR